ncbi:TetR/AcrR family transcriptional regulator [Parahaliea maris]|uniref:TetR/AcrR family transcriptional regulator n=1 Tax=Parahaliea maris TaxID=2716870 RepID=UPI00164F6456|nr:TetR/AcrR family transcriptional regulator [Parahaliea maris]
MKDESKTITDGRRQRGEQSRQRILSEALRLFSRHGYAGTSLSAIRDATGLPVSSLHHHFGSKAGICLAAIDALGETLSGSGLQQRLQSVTGAEARAHLLVQGILRHNEQEYPTLLLIIRLAMDGDDIDPAIRPAVQAIRKKAVDGLAANLRLVFAERSPPLPRPRCEVMARRLLAIMDGWLVSQLTDYPDALPAWSARDLEHLVLALAED